MTEPAVTRDPAAPAGPPEDGPEDPTASLDDLFAPPALEWRRLSPRYLELRRLTNVVSWIVLSTVPAVIFGFVFGLWWLSVSLWVGAAVIIGLRHRFLVRSTAAWGYVERADDLYISHGVLFRSLTAVPYGRMQLVEVESGPFERRFGLATVTLKTASANTDATIPGLAPEEAARLRDQLTALGEARQSGL